MRLLRRIVKSIRHPDRAVRVTVHHTLVNPRVAGLIGWLGGPRLMGWLTIWAIDPGPWQRDRATVLVLDRLYFAKDVEQLRQRSRGLNLPTLDTHILSVAQALWLPEELQEQIAYAPRSRLEHSTAWAIAETYAAEVLQRAQSRWNVQGVLSSNVDYWQHEAVRRACRTLGLPYLVLCQELQTLPFTYDESVKLYSDADFRYSGRAVAVFGPKTRDMLIESRCCAPEQVWVTGAPRLDPWLDGSIESSSADAITLLAYDGEQYLAPKNYREALAIFAEASVRHAGGGFDFVLKCKDAEDEARARSYLDAVDHRLVITNAMPLTELFPRSRLVIGYNTLAIIEALFSPAEIAVPQWGDAARPPAEQNVDPTCPICREHFRFLMSADAWRALLDEVVATPRPVVDCARRIDLVGRWFHVPPEGSASHTTERFLLNFLKNPAAVEDTRVRVGSVG